MKIQFTILPCLFCFLIYNISNSQNSLGFYGSMIHGDLIENSDIDFFDSNLSWGLGVSFSKRIRPKVDLIYQLGIERTGWIIKDFFSFKEGEVIDDYYQKGLGIVFSFGSNYFLYDGQNFNLGFTLLSKIVYEANQKENLHIQNLNGSVPSYHYERPHLLLGAEAELSLQFKITEDYWLKVQPGLAGWLSSFNQEYLQRIRKLDVAVLRHL